MHHGYYVFDLVTISGVIFQLYKVCVTSRGLLFWNSGLFFNQFGMDQKWNQYFKIPSLAAQWTELKYSLKSLDLVIFYFQILLWFIIITQFITHEYQIFFGLSSCAMLPWRNNSRVSMQR